MSLPDPLINTSGEPFAEDVLDDAGDRLGRSDNDDRVAFRNANAESVATHGAPRVLVVAGPGAGKSTLFVRRIETWSEVHGNKPIYVSSFVRKLVRDLRSDVEARGVAGHVTVETLHHLARSLVERNGGTQSLRFGRYIKMIGPEWKEMVWGDTLSFHADVDPAPSLRDLENQFFANVFARESPWPEVRNSYFRLCQFYNAIGFADSIVWATDAVLETPELVEHSLWIVDEFQDFNAAEDALIRACVRSAESVLLAGDDDQALYQELKASHPEIIRGYYKDTEWTNAMLPFCGRCEYHIVMAATEFLAQGREEESIRKIFLPLKVSQDAERVNLVLCSTPQVAVDYVQDFIERFRADIEARRAAIQGGTEKDPFLLVLSPQRNVAAYLGSEGERLRELVDEWKIESVGPERDYLTAMLFYRSDKYPNDNFAFRKVMEVEGIPPERAHEIIAQALDQGVALREVDAAEVLACAQKTASVREVLDSERPPNEQAAALQGLLHVTDADRLAVDLASFPVAGEAGEGEEEELIETAGAMSPVELLTMVGAKGLSADHVIIVGCDNINMGRASRQAFFVAMTRARRSLHLLPARRARGASLPHDYISELPPDHLSYAKATAKGIERFDSRGEFEKYLGALQFAKKRAKGGIKKKPVKKPRKS